MGYTTDFEGSFQLNEPLAEEHRMYLKQFNHTRRMKRDASKTEVLPDPIRLLAKLPVGNEGGYFVGATGWAGQDHGEDILDYNHSPTGQPGLWCQWTPTEDGQEIEWDGGEKFYDYVEWIEYLIKHFLEPWGYKLNGQVRWRGEEMSDLGVITIEDNIVSTRTVSW